MLPFDYDGFLLFIKALKIAKNENLEISCFNGSFLKKNSLSLLLSQIKKNLSL